jgi:hypothetical protein
MLLVCALYSVDHDYYCFSNQSDYVCALGGEYDVSWCGEKRLSYITWVTEIC